jgi:hypothetical protein
MRARTLFGVLALLMLAAGLVSVALGLRTTAQARNEEFTVEILPNGFNPEECLINRDNNYMYFLNKDTKPRRIVVDELYSPTDELLFDTGMIQPGERKIFLYIVSIVDYEYRDFDNPSLTGRVFSTLTNEGASNCRPQPPTPTPTNTPTITPTPTATLPAAQKPPRCIGLQGCSVAGVVSRDSD